MSTTRHYRLGDLEPNLVLLVTDTAGTAINLTGYTVALHTQHVETGVAKTFPLTITDAVAGKVTRVWAANDFTVTGTYECYVKLTLNARDQTAPKPSLIYIVIEPAFTP